MTFVYTDDAVANIETSISAERFAAYLRIARGNRWVALKMYEKNAVLSGALYPVIQGLEVTVRNSIHNLMCNRIGCEEWYDRFKFHPSERAEIDAAKDSLKEKNQPTTAGRLVSELTFGFWVKLTARGYEEKLWNEHLHRIFPLRVNRPGVNQRFVLLKTLRNRMAHHERIVGRTRQLPLEYAETIEAIRWLNPVVADWVDHNNNFKELYDKKFPPKRPAIVLAAAVEIPKDH